MPKYKVDVSDPAVSRGLTPFVVQADSEEGAKEALAKLNGTTVEGLAAEGLTFWTVTQVPDEFVNARPTSPPNNGDLSEKLGFVAMSSIREGDIPFVPAPDQAGQ